MLYERLPSILLVVLNEFGGNAVKVPIEHSRTFMSKWRVTKALLTPLHYVGSRHYGSV